LNEEEEGDMVPDNAEPVLMLLGTVNPDALGIVGNVMVELTVIVPTE
jgi:hypothetical protein